MLFCDSTLLLVPCGIETGYRGECQREADNFYLYRVELKRRWRVKCPPWQWDFYLYRVELKQVTFNHYLRRE